MLEEYFKILGLPKTARQDEIKKAFRFLAKKYHPDVSKEPNASKKFVEITEAYEILTNQKILETLRIIAENEEERKVEQQEEMRDFSSVGKTRYDSKRSKFSFNTLQNMFQRGWDNLFLTQRKKK